MLHDKHINLEYGHMMEMGEYDAYKPSCGCGRRREYMMPEMQQGMMPEAGYSPMGMGYPSMGTGCCSPGCTTQPICECPRERCINRCIVHEVPHICPVNTKIINTHIFRHTYSPMYTCCEQNVACNVQEGSCCNF